MSRHQAEPEMATAAVERAVGAPVAGFVRNAWEDVHGALQKRRLLIETAPGSAVFADVAQLAMGLAPARAEGNGRSAR